MKVLNVELINSYKIYETDISEVGKIIRKYTSSQKVIVICDSNLKDLYLQKLNKFLESVSFSIDTIFLEANEKNKSIEESYRICQKILASNIDRNTPIIALGGGITGDIAGFCASIVLRGLPFFQIPTTLLAMVDSSVGGKCGVNTFFGKNTIGTFYQPIAVIIDINLLNSLPTRHYLSGYAECLKYALLFSEEYFNFLDSNVDKFLEKNKQYLEQIIMKSCEYKIKIVQQDEKEILGIRFLLNLGHTFAHAFETINDYKDSLTHGEAVAIGLGLAYKFSSYLKLSDEEDYHKIIQHLNKVSLPTSISSIIKDINIDKILDIIGKDKKNYNNQLTMILAKSIGSCFVKLDVEKSIFKQFLLKELT